VGVPGGVPYNPDNVLNGADVYVVRIMSDDTFGESKPCSNCIQILKSCQIYRVFYSVRNPDTEELSYRVEKVSEIEANHTSSGNKNLIRNGILTRIPRL